MEPEPSYWLQIGEGVYQYTSQVTKGSYMAMERVCGFRDEVPANQYNEPVTTQFESPAGDKNLKVRGWVQARFVESPGD